ncbi:hypothetical protein HDU96_007569 [Phlyctochytrium bullatum]|nr:hypothetical protein HDU96_007569 [Phlyctochytrium bullatum]
MTDCQTLSLAFPTLDIPSESTECCGLEVNGVNAVKCQNGRVTELDLSSTGLTGLIPSSISRLSGLKALAYRNLTNHFKVPRPDESISLLTVCLRSIENNCFDSIRNASAYSATRMPMRTTASCDKAYGRARRAYADGGDCGVIGRSFPWLEVPAECCGKTGRGFRVDCSEGFAVALTVSGAPQGPLPPSLGQLTYLEQLNLSGNSFVGPVPLELFNLTNLRILDLGNNAMSGILPKEIGQLTKLSDFNITANLLSGPLPNALVNLRQLQNLDVSRNFLNGTVATFISRFPGTKRIDENCFRMVYNSSSYTSTSQRPASICAEFHGRVAPPGVFPIAAITGVFASVVSLSVLLGMIVIHCRRASSRKPGFAPGLVSVNTRSDSPLAGTKGGSGRYMELDV